MATAAEFADVLARRRDAVMAEWIDRLKSDSAGQSGRLKAGELETQCARLFDLLLPCLRHGGSHPDDALRDFLGDVSRLRAIQGFSPRDTANFVLSVKLPLFDALEAEHKGDDGAIAAATRSITSLLDSLALYTTEVFQRSREEVIIRQQREITELSTPVVKLWDGVLALPLIGTLDSERTQVVMENLLQSIVDHTAEIAIIDITGVPTVDTLVAQHLLKAIAAARLMGADCIISGIRPQIAQTMVHLGVELNVISKASLADAFALALNRIGRRVVPIAPEAVRN